jgi:hypothetical protein
MVKAEAEILNQILEDGYKRKIMSYILFDVGANWGERSLTIAQRDFNVEVYAFEPTPSLINHLLGSSAMFSDRYHIVPCALSDHDGQANFYIQNNPGQGCNSLNEFNTGLESSWKERAPEFTVADTIQVEVRRLDTLLDKREIWVDHIDYFKCDTQGSDLKVLQGMGKYIELIRKGEVECAKNEEVKLYKNNHTLDEMTEFLKSKGFTITSIESNDHLDNEWNVYFQAS